MKFAILGAGKIAEIMASTVINMKEVVPYAIASRDKDKSDEFAKKYHFIKSFGSYEEMLQDNEVELVYIATPHSFHYEHIKMCLEYGKNVLCEKSFTVNAAQAKEVLQMAEDKKLLLTEAIWTRYMPSRKMIQDILQSGLIGEVSSLTANLCYPIDKNERIVEPALAGGALLDIGVYTINFTLMCFGDAFNKVSSHAVLTEKGVDSSNSITIEYPDGKMAVLHSNFKARSDRRGMLFGTKGYLEIDNINNCQKIKVYGLEDQIIKIYEVPKQITGYEYEVMACKNAIDKGLLECEEMPHKETIYVMQIMDELRLKWGLKYPCE